MAGINHADVRCYPVKQFAARANRDGLDRAKPALWLHGVMAPWCHGARVSRRRGIKAPGSTRTHTAGYGACTRPAEFPAFRYSRRKLAPWRHAGRVLPVRVGSCQRRHSNTIVLVQSMVTNWLYAETYRRQPVPSASDNRRTPFDQHPLPARPLGSNKPNIMGAIEIAIAVLVGADWIGAETKR